MKKDPAIVKLFAVPTDRWPGDALALGVYENGKPQKALARLGEGWAEEVDRVLTAGWLRGKEGESLLLSMAGGASDPRVLLLVGLGKADAITPLTLENVGARLVKAAATHGMAKLGCLISMDRHNGISPGRCVEHLAEGAWGGSYRFDRFKTKGNDSENGHQKTITLELAVKEKKMERMVQKLERLHHVCNGRFLAQNLGNLPGNLLTPEMLAAEARKMAEDLPIQVTVWNEKELKKNRMNGILAVGQGSSNPPRLIVMEYRQGGEGPLLAVVGKAVTFDSGGISLKPGAKMEEMKFDMAGGAAVFGFMHAIASMKLKVNCIGLVPAAENLPSGHAQRPGDVIETASGQWVEVINTDAEGRLILADALHHARSLAPDMIIDLATLTGACVIALGHEASAVMGFNKKMLRKLGRAGKRVGEKLWPLPLFPGYQELLKSTVADMKNVGGRDAGAITGGCFLSRFIDKKTPWAHIDIAGTAWDLSGKKPSQPKGATGVGVRLLCRFAEKELL
ncbi:MAG: aminopeptidase A, Metallo peptidase, MEROPS family M17 [Magnetococcales bacterium]|nr:aminopeptidase A, Metallo peptidase, MEROPS family M17 [Magnetococcales bacterium]HIJ84593.1 leucyl aminopeptidase [Magnetococcales bacterium]